LALGAAAIRSLDRAYPVRPRFFAVLVISPADGAVAQRAHVCALLEGHVAYAVMMVARVWCSQARLRCSRLRHIIDLVVTLVFSSVTGGTSGRLPLLSLSRGAAASPR
jgi:hypothetical protein